MLVKTLDAKGPALDYIVALCRNIKLYKHTLGQYVINHANGSSSEYKPSSNWALGGPIISQCKISLNNPRSSGPEEEWTATGDAGPAWGPTQLIAGMRCYCRMYSNEFEIPDDLTKGDNHEQCTKV